MMGSLLLVQAVILGVVEGLTEFLPVSSTGHLIVAGDLIGFAGERAKTFEIFIQLGSILGVVWYYRAKVWALAAGLHQPAQKRFVLQLGIAFLPAALLGWLLHRPIKTYLFSPLTVAGALIAGGIAILAIERWYRRREALGTQRVQALGAISSRAALGIGFAQCLSLFPGVSRAGATIMGGVLAGLDRRTATEFSFFLAMPTMFAATLYELSQNLHRLDAHDALVFATGFVTAFLTALFVVKAFLAYVSRHSFVPFAWYRIGFGLAVLAYFWPGPVS